MPRRSSHQPLDLALSLEGMQWVNVVFVITCSLLLSELIYWQLKKEPQEDDRKEVESLRILLLAQFQIVLTLQSQTLPAIQVENATVENRLPDDFDDLDENMPSKSQPSVTSSTGIPENRKILLPRACFNQGHSLQNVELNLRMCYAGHYLNTLQEIIADKSFHYSNVIRVAPNKGVWTRAQSVIVKINQLIALYCRMYSWCRSEMVHLDIDEGSLSKFQILRKEDVSRMFPSTFIFFYICISTYDTTTLPIVVPIPISICSISLCGIPDWSYRFGSDRYLYVYTLRAGDFWVPTLLSIWLLDIYCPYTDITNIRELIAYCDAQFRTALKVITTPNNELKREVYFKILALMLCYLLWMTVFESNFAYPELAWLWHWVISSIFLS